MSSVSAAMGSGHVTMYFRSFLLEREPATNVFSNWYWFVCRRTLYTCTIERWLLGKTIFPMSGSRCPATTVVGPLPFPFSAI
jgi:hypothetical protein